MSSFQLLFAIYSLKDSSMLLVNWDKKWPQNKQPQQLDLSMY